MGEETSSALGEDARRVGGVWGNTVCWGGMRGQIAVRDSSEEGGRDLPTERTGADGCGDDRLVPRGERDLRGREDNVVVFCLSGGRT